MQKIVLYITSKALRQIIDHSIKEEDLVTLECNNQIGNTISLEDFMTHKGYLLGDNDVDYLIIDLSALIDSDEKIVSAIGGFLTMHETSRVIIVAPKNEAGDLILSKLFAIGVRNFAVGSDFVILKQRLKKCMSENGMSYKEAIEYKDVIEREKEQYASNPDIDTSRSKYNFHIVKPESRYYHFIQSRIEQAGCRTRKDSTRFVDTLITASPEFFKKKSPKEIQEFFQRAADFLIGRVGRENIVSAVVHMDEKTPHLHLVFVPLTEDNRLCAKEIIGNRANLTKWQDDFHAYMVEKYPDLERGESASKTGRKHIPTRLFKQAVNLSKQARAIEATLGDITPFNAGKKKEEALSLLKKWFPQMENFSGQLKKYKVTINDLLAENEQLEARAKASEKGKMKDTMERAKLKSELDDLQRLVDRIPPDILVELKRQQRHTRER